MMIVQDVFAADLFAGKTVFVTGGGSGINLGVAKNFAALGANVGICGRTQEKLDRAADEIREFGGKVVAQAADVRDYDALSGAIDRTGQELGPISALVCGAAGNFPCAAEGLSPNGFKSVVDIDLLGSFNASKAALGHLKETGGSIIFITAPQAFQAYAMQSHVGAAKAGVDNLMQNLALEWGPYGIRCNSIAPGPIEGTEGVTRLLPEAAAKKVNAAIPLKRQGTVDEIGQAAVFLASPLATYITGTVLICDGGQFLQGSGIFTQAIMEAAGGSA